MGDQSRPANQTEQPAEQSGAASQSDQPAEQSQSEQPPSPEQTGAASQSEQPAPVEQSGAASQSEQPPPTQRSPQIYPDAGGDGDDGNKFEKSASVDPLTLEMEVQDLIDRVSVLEQGHAAVLNLQRSIL